MNRDRRFSTPDQLSFNWENPEEKRSNADYRGEIDYGIRIRVTNNWNSVVMFYFDENKRQEMAFYDYDPNSDLYVSEQIPEDDEFSILLNQKVKELRPSNFPGKLRKVA